ncbi:MAG: hypothetical protein QM733_07225 [Ilumatobacteraceae bacterium]
MQDATDDAALDDAIVDETETGLDVDAAIDAVEFEHLPDEEGVSDPIATARRRHGTAGAVLAAGLFGIDIALGRKPREDIPVVVTASSEPTDIDTDGIRVDVDEQTSVVAPALPRQEPPGRSGRRRRGRRTT